MIDELDLKSLGAGQKLTQAIRPAMVWLDVDLYSKSNQEEPQASVRGLTRSLLLATWGQFDSIAQRACDKLSSDPR